nr:hypothetical protein [uncultured Campylobacter sp.]
MRADTPHATSSPNHTKSGLTLSTQCTFRTGFSSMQQVTTRDIFMKRRPAFALLR